jgi:hypothetical protein
VGVDGATVLVAADGKAYMIPDDHLAQYEVTDPSVADQLNKVVSGTLDSSDLRWKPQPHRAAVRVPVQAPEGGEVRVPNAVMTW